MIELDKLIEAVEAGKFTFNGWADYLIDRKNMGRVDDAYSGDLNAALALHEALLPGWGYDAGYKSASVWDARGGWGVFRHEHKGAPARAWLLAILKAYRSIQEDSHLNSICNEREASPSVAVNLEDL